ncbi:CopG family ribbon-helix-helix protein [Pseudomonas sp. NIBRBAC000502773]|uniref:CopG family ribbon-helix-helix protein n=1 Tax=Pseudomonas sp. NIBRBAC000502773 TaxID=2590776 RepID=UPI001130353B|nr:ribbon-helix-helix protein, CopG family [Pseudomonas sp. NIBRBAC000502773]QDG58128.1 ribbon-helix-helix protein, CopG family [Pseudomonas sp. NIBRBAC000502773]
MYGAALWQPPVLSFQVKLELASELDQLAQATDRDRQYHLQRALSRYLADESWHFKSVQEGIADANAGAFPSCRESVSSTRLPGADYDHVCVSNDL